MLTSRQERGFGDDVLEEVKEGLARYHRVIRLPTDADRALVSG
jgi:hypothetical protein